MQSRQPECSKSGLTLHSRQQIFQYLKVVLGADGPSFGMNYLRIVYPFGIEKYDHYDFDARFLDMHFFVLMRCVIAILLLVVWPQVLISNTTMMISKNLVHRQLFAQHVYRHLIVLNFSSPRKECGTSFAQIFSYPSL